MNLYGLAYRMPKYVYSSLLSIFISTLDEPLEITVIDSKSDKSEEIYSVLDDFLKDGLIKRYIKSSGNCKGFGLREAFKLFPPKEEFFIMTDLDLIVEDPDWFHKTKKAMETQVLSACTLSTENYIPPNGGYIDSDSHFGYWLMGINTQLYKESLAFPETVQDHHLLSFAKNYGIVKKIDSECYHLAWDLWKDNPEYFAEKVRGIDWLDGQNCKYEVVE